MWGPGEGCSEPNGVAPKALLESALYIGTSYQQILEKIEERA